jgi:hypothetical protein
MSMDSSRPTKVFGRAGHTRRRGRERSYTLLSVDRVGRGMDRCSEDGCENDAAVRVYVPWAEDRDVCTAHARVLVQRDGVVAEPLDGAEENWR